MVKIRKVSSPQKISPKIKDQLDALERIAFPGDDLEAKEPGHWWIAYDQGKPVAYLGLEPIYGEANAFFTRVGVVPSYRGRGLQRKLMRVMERGAKRLGFRHIVTYVADWNLISANNIIKCGYLLYRPTEEYGLPHSFYFRKKLF